VRPRLAHGIRHLLGRGNRLKPAGTTTKRSEQFGDAADRADRDAPAAKPGQNIDNAPPPAAIPTSPRRRRGQGKRVNTLSAFLAMIFTAISR